MSDADFPPDRSLYVEGVKDGREICAETMQQEIERLKNGIWEYGVHRPSCAKDSGKPCDCGFADLLGSLLDEPT